MTNSGIIWDQEGVDNLAKALTFCYKTQTTYKEPLDLADRVTGWRFILEEDYTLDQVFYALKKFMKTSKNMPVPADIGNILNPTFPEITQTEYFHAKKQWALEDFSEFSDHLDTIKAYEKQTKVNRETVQAYRIENEQVRQLVQNSVKKIGH